MQVDFYQLGRDPLAAVLASIAMRVLAGGGRLLVVTGDEDLSRLLELEALCIGIAGKQAGWLALQAADRSELGDIDFDRLIARAADQRARLEPHRLEAAAAALGD